MCKFVLQIYKINIGKSTKTDVLTENQTTYYSGNYIYNENHNIKYILTGYGKIVPKDGSGYKRHYNLSDHLGNVRVTFTKTGQVLQEDSYYPFEMQIKDLSYSALADDDKNLYLYNAKQLQ